MVHIVVWSLAKHFWNKRANGRLETARDGLGLGLSKTELCGQPLSLKADIRLRSGEANDGPKVPNRSRASKVQQNVLTIIGVTDRTNVATELEALGDKTAATLATSFERLLRSVCSRILTQPQAGSAETWIFHMLVGDGIPTNEAAAKLLLVHSAKSAGARHALLADGREVRHTPGRPFSEERR